MKASASSADTSFFALFHMEPSVEVALAPLEATFHRLSRQLHPDCHTGADAKTRLRLLQQTSQLNEAYATLSNPERRAFYVLKLCGVDLDGPHLPRGLQVPPAFLGRMLELQEALQQASATGQADTLHSLECLAKEALQTELEAACRCLHSFLQHAQDATRQQAAAHLLCVRYWQRFLKNAEASQEALFS